MDMDILANPLIQKLRHAMPGQYQSVTWFHFTSGKIVIRILFCAVLITMIMTSFLLHTRQKLVIRPWALPTLESFANEDNGVDDSSDSATEESSWPFNEESLAQDDPRLVQLIREDYIIPPPVPINGSQPDPSFWGDPATTRYSKFRIVEDKLIPLLFLEDGKPVRGGTFLESGSLGSHLSATLYMERFLGWRGLIVEMVPIHLHKILELFRFNSHVVPACVAPVAWPTKTNFTTAKSDKINPMATLLAPEEINDGKPWAADTEKKKKLIRDQADCFPLYSILLAANLTRIDFVNLSVGGLEYEVLQTIPFDKVYVKVFLFSLANVKTQSPLIHKFMIEHNYIKVPPGAFIIRDRDPLYVRKDWAAEKNFVLV